MSVADTARAAAQALQRQPSTGRARIIAHADVDSLCAATILVQALRRTHRAFHLTHEHRLTPSVLAPLEQDPSDATLLIGFAPDASLRESLAARLVITIDARPLPALATPDPRHHHLVPSTQPDAGLPSLSCAEIALHLARALGQEQGLIHLALLGAWSIGRQPPLPAATALLDAATVEGTIDTRLGAAADGDTLLHQLARLPPAWKAAADDIREPAAFLIEHGLAPAASVHELPRPELEQWISLLAVRGLRRGVDPNRLHELIRTTPSLRTLGGLPAPRVVGLLSAAIERDDHALAFAFLLGDTSVQADLEALEAELVRLHEAVPHPGANA